MKENVRKKKKKKKNKKNNEGRSLIPSQPASIISEAHNITNNEIESIFEMRNNQRTLNNLNQFSNKDLRIVSQNLFMKQQ